ncbi:hypothetical protein YC2023_089663 [Brassica napus]
MSKLLMQQATEESERNTKREVFRNYLEPNGILDTLTIGIVWFHVLSSGRGSLQVIEVNRKKVCKKDILTSLLTMK